MIRSAHCGRLFSDYDEDVVMVTTIGIDPYEATHTAVAVNDSETVLGGLAVPADRSQTNTLLDWVRNLDGDGRVWAVEAAGGLGYLLSQQLIARGEHVDNVPPVLASRIRLLGSGRSDKNDPNDARPVAIAVLRQPGLVLVRGDDPHPCAGDVGETPPRLTALRTQAVARFHAVVMLLRPGGMTQRLSADKASAGAAPTGTALACHKAFSAIWVSSNPALASVKNINVFSS